MTTVPPLPAHWSRVRVSSPTLSAGVEVWAAKGVATVDGGHRLQTLNLYAPATAANADLEGRPITRLPGGGGAHVQVHVHGGAWRDPFTDAASIEAAVAHAFHDADASPLTAVASLNYTLTEFPLHPVAPYDARKDEPKDPAREAVHPQHLADVLSGLRRLRDLGLEDGSYILTGHSAGSCLVMQAALAAPAAFGLSGEDDAPIPAAAIGLNGLYDLPGLVHGADADHEGTTADYRVMLSNAFGPDEAGWRRASPAHLDLADLRARSADGRTPALLILDQSPDDQLVSSNQRDRLHDHLSQVGGLGLRIGRRCTGKHAEPWLKGDMIWNSVRDALAELGA